MLGAVINYLTRSTLAVSAPTLLTDLHITTQEYSYITAAFQAPSCCSRCAAMCWT